jgi:hypothetical protein
MKKSMDLCNKCYLDWSRIFSLERTELEHRFCEFPPMLNA